MIIDWSRAEGANADLAEGVANCAELDLGLPFVLFLESLDRAGISADAQDAILGELGVLTWKVGNEVLESA